MNIGSLFVEMGVKGSTSAIREVGSLTKGLRDVSIIANQSIQFLSKLYTTTKAVVDENSKLGNELKNYSNELGISTDSLQRWDYAARLSGARTGEMSAAFKSLQNSLLEIRDNGASGYLNQFFSQISSLDKDFSVERFLSGDLKYAMGTIRKLAKDGTYDLARLNRALSELGISDSISNFLRTSDVDLSKISRDLIIPKGNVKALDDMYQGLQRIEQVSRVAVADLATVFDKQLINDIGSLVKEFASLVKELAQLLRESGLIRGLSSTLKFFTEGATNTIQRNKQALQFSRGEISQEEYFKRFGGGDWRAAVDRLPKTEVNITNNVTSRDDASSIADAISQSTIDSLNSSTNNSAMGQIPVGAR